MRNERVEYCVESICNKGCQAVRSDIAHLERQGSLPETAGLSEEEVGRVLRELKAIMSVYGDVCRLT
jgi:hypothetical protein